MSRVVSLLLCLLAIPASLACHGSVPAVGGPVAGSAPPPAAAEEPERALDTSLWQRVAILGASASDGFGTANEGFGRIRLADVFELLLPADRQPVVNASSELFFLQPAEYGEQMHGQVADADPSLTIALDYLFWYLYGRHGTSEDDRLAMLETGLELAASLPGLVVVGTIPDMRAAVDTGMLPSVFVPRPETIARANARLGAWAAEHEHVVVLPLAERLPAMLAEAEAGGAVLMQDDALHPTVRGLAQLATETCEELIARFPGIASEELLLDADALAALAVGVELDQPAASGGE